jgi:glycopeptide antibiotics resistance protein
MRQEKRNIFKLPLTARLVILLVYLIILSYFLFFAGGFGRTGESTAFSVNLLPFTEIIRCFKYYDSLPKGFFLSNFVGNIIAFIPFGFLFASLLSYKKRFTCLLTVLVSALLSAMVEIIQFVTRTGSCDIDDVILNTLGGTIGYIIFYVLFVRKEKE